MNSPVTPSLTALAPAPLQPASPQAFPAPPQIHNAMDSTTYQLATTLVDLLLSPHPPPPSSPPLLLSSYALSLPLLRQTPNSPPPVPSSHPRLFHLLVQLLAKPLGLSYDGLLSLARNRQTMHTRRKAAGVRQDPRHRRGYDETGDITQQARRAQYPPYLMAKIIVESVTGLRGKRSSDAMKDPSTSLLPWSGAPPLPLASAVLRAIAADPLNGPRHDLYRRRLGVEYEIRLQRILDRANIPYTTEDKLRELGASKTPDVLLDCPMGALVGGKWRQVCWIDSKALFGDEHTHKGEVLKQALGYVHRYGPGMILYWFGHAPAGLMWEGVGGEGGGDGKDILVVDRMPEVRMFPNGTTALGGGKRGDGGVGRPFTIEE